MTWIQTLDGKQFDLVNPTPEMIDFMTIAVVLSRIPRFGGHTNGNEIYSVAQHCVEGANAILRDTGRTDWAAAFLIHDAHEAYIGDDVTPKIEALANIAVQNLPFLGAEVRYAYRHLQRKIDCAIYTAAGVQWPLDSETSTVVKTYDLRMLRTERDARMQPPTWKAQTPWAAPIETAWPIDGVDTSDWPRAMAEALFRIALHSFFPNIKDEQVARLTQNR